MTQAQLDFSEKKGKDTVLAKVKVILQDFPGARDDYAELDHRFYPKGLSTHEFFKKIHNGDLPSMESVHRARRKIQEDHPRLRGETYNKRKRKADGVTENINIEPTDTIESIS